MRGWGLTEEAGALLTALSTTPDPLKAIQQLGHIGGPAAIPELSAYLVPTDRRLATEALAAIRMLLRTVLPSEVRRLDREVREHWPDRDGGFRSLGPEDVQPLGDAAGDLVTAAVVCSMHGNGHVREEAVRVLSAHGGGPELSYLLLRAADWVEQVRRPAQAAVEARLTETYLPAIVDNLAVFEGDSFIEGRARDLHEAVTGLLARPGSAPVLLEALTHPDRPTRRAAGRRYVAAGHPLPPLLERALHQDDVVVASLAADAAIIGQTGQALEDTLRALWGQRVGRLRQIALKSWITSRSAELPQRIAEASLDPHAGVRDIAQHHLREAGVDLAALYRDALPDHPREGLLGLSEVGSQQDAALAVEYLESSSTAVRRAALRALGSLAPEDHLEALLRTLPDQSAGVAREARQGLERVRPHALERIWELTLASTPMHVRSNGFRLLRRAGKWDRLRYGLRGLAFGDPDLAVRSAELVQDTLREWNRSFVSPSRVELTEILGLLAVANQPGQRRLVDEVRFALKPFLDKD